MSPTGADFPRERRIRRSDEFRALSRSGRQRRGQAFVVLSAPARGGQARLGVTVSRRVGGAVARNRVKRRIREWFRRDEVARASGLDLVVIARPGAGRRSWGDTTSELARLLDAVRSEPSRPPGGVR